MIHANGTMPMAPEKCPRPMAGGIVHLCGTSSFGHEDRQRKSPLHSQGAFAKLWCPKGRELLLGSLDRSLELGASGDLWGL